MSCHNHSLTHSLNSHPTTHSLTHSLFPSLRYKRFMELGEVGFQKNLPPAPFDWSRGLPERVSGAVVFDESAQENACSNSAAPLAPRRPSAFFDVTIEDDDLGRLVVEVSE